MPAPLSPLTPLGVREVLLSSLPTSLGTSQEPERYTVEAVFDRRPDPDEVQLLAGVESKARLAAAGYYEVRLHVADRRLVVERTSLEELRDGLGGVIASLLNNVSGQVASRRDQEQARVQAASDGETARTTAVAELAQSVSFAIPNDPTPPLEHQPALPGPRA